jgi:hypothetical protein
MLSKAGVSLPLLERVLLETIKAVDSDSNSHSDSNSDSDSDSDVDSDTLNLPVGYVKLLDNHAGYVKLSVLVAYYLLDE